MKNRYEFCVLFDVVNGNPNGDPALGNAPRQDHETGLGIITDVCLKRKIRNYISVSRQGTAGFDIYVKDKAVLNNTHKDAYKECGVNVEDEKAVKTAAKDVNKVEVFSKFMCKKFFDVRAFGALMDTGDCHCGTIRGPIQIGFSRSFDTINPQNVQITRCCVTNEKDEEKERTMGDKYIVSYALYKAEGFINAFDAEKTGFSEEDLQVLWEALKNMFETDRSSARGKMTTRKVYVFKHDNQLGKASADTLFNTIVVSKRDGVSSPASYEDYVIELKDVPAGVERTEV